MSLISLRQMLDHAAERDYGVPAFNVNNLEQMRAIMEAADEVDAPVIVQASAGARKYAGSRFLSHLIEAAVEEFPDIPVCMHQDHGNTTSLGFLFDGKFGYSTDVVGMRDDVFDKLAGIDLWIVEALRASPHQAHSHYEQTFGWIDRVKPKRAVLTHLGLEADYEKLMAICPVGTEPGIDGLSFDL